MKRIDYVLNEFEKAKRQYTVLNLPEKFSWLADPPGLEGTREEFIEHSCPYQYIDEVKQIALDFYSENVEKIESNEVIEGNKLHDIACPRVSPTETDCNNCWKAEIDASFNEPFEDN